MRIFSTWFIVLFAAASVLLQPGCSADDVQPEFVARVGDQVFTHADLSAALGTLVLVRDSAQAAQKLIDQWITNEVLMNEAVRRGLRSDTEIQIQLKENERSILVTALLEELFRENNTAVTRSDLDTYYDQHRSQLAITEPFARIRYTIVSSFDSAKVAELEMNALISSPNADSEWVFMSNRYRSENVRVPVLSDSYYPISQIAASIPGLEQIISTMLVGTVIEPFEANGQIHVIQLVDRLEPGTIPESYMIEEFVRTRVAIEARKQMLARQVQRLRNEAIAREELEVN